MILGGSSAKVPQYQVEAEECEDGPNNKDVHILRAKRKKISVLPINTNSE